MKVERVEVEDNNPFVTITLTRKEAEILKELCHYNIDDITHKWGYEYKFPKDANETFGYPMHRQLLDLGV